MEGGGGGRSSGGGGGAEVSGGGGGAASSGGGGGTSMLLLFTDFIMQDGPREAGLNILNLVGLVLLGGVSAMPMEPRQGSKIPYFLL